MFLVSKKWKRHKEAEIVEVAPLSFASPMLALSGLANLLSFASGMTSSTAAHTFLCFHRPETSIFVR